MSSHSWRYDVLRLRMKTKTEATKILLENGWTYEEIESVLGSQIIVSLPSQTTFRAEYPPIIFESERTGQCLGSPPVIISGKKITKFGGIKRTFLNVK